MPGRDFLYIFLLLLPHSNQTHQELERGREMVICRGDWGIISIHIYHLKTFIKSSQTTFQEHHSSSPSSPPSIKARAWMHGIGDLLSEESWLNPLLQMRSLDAIEVGTLVLKPLFQVIYTNQTCYMQTKLYIYIHGTYAYMGVYTCYFWCRLTCISHIWQDFMIYYIFVWYYRTWCLHTTVHTHMDQTCIFWVMKYYKWYSMDKLRYKNIVYEVLIMNWTINICFKI